MLLIVYMAIKPQLSNDRKEKTNIKSQHKQTKYIAQHIYN